mmetsp:Transcript_88262/g.175391  ORF Transcript_88262/g.175391 Transcript_88262/m.175391 type:complete len:635 (+) Transcript_88262:70-1974(+)
MERIWYRTRPCLILLIGSGLVSGYGSDTAAAVAEASPLIPAVPLPRPATSLDGADRNVIEGDGTSAEFPLAASALGAAPGVASCSSGLFQQMHSESQMPIRISEEPRGATASKADTESAAKQSLGADLAIAPMRAVPPIGPQRRDDQQVFDSGVDSQGLLLPPWALLVLGNLTRATAAANLTASSALGTLTGLAQTHLRKATIWARALARPVFGDSTETKLVVISLTAIVVVILLWFWSIFTRPPARGGQRRGASSAAMHAEGMRRMQHQQEAGTFHSVPSSARALHHQAYASPKVVPPYSGELTFRVPSSDGESCTSTGPHFCADLVVPEGNECSLLVPKLPSSRACPGGEVLIQDEQGVPVFFAAWSTLAARDTKRLILRSATDDTVFGHCRDALLEPGGRLAGINIYPEGQDKPFGVLCAGSGRDPDGFSVWMQSGWQIFLTGDFQSGEVKARDETGSLLAMISASGVSSRTVRIGPNVDAGLLTLTMLAMDLLEDTVRSGGTLERPCRSPSRTSYARPSLPCADYNSMVWAPVQRTPGSPPTSYTSRSLPATVVRQGASPSLPQSGWRDGQAQPVQPLVGAWSSTRAWARSGSANRGNAAVVVPPLALGSVPMETSGKLLGASVSLSPTR